MGARSLFDLAGLDRFSTHMQIKDIFTLESIPNAPSDTSRDENIAGEVAEASSKYELAISDAKRNDFIQEQDIANT
eukprot:7176743-Ditylum_brightwellii.AAC.1